MRARPTGRALRGWCAAATPLVLAISFIPHSTTSTPLARLVDPFAARGTLPLNGGGAGGDGARGRALGSAAGLAPLRGGGGSIGQKNAPPPADAGSPDLGHALATFPVEQPALDSETDGEVLASYVYEGIRPTISEKSHKSSSCGSPSPGARAVAAWQASNALMSPEAQRQLHYTLMTEAKIAGKLRDHRQPPPHTREGEREDERESEWGRWDSRHSFPHTRAVGGGGRLGANSPTSFGGGSVVGDVPGELTDIVMGGGGEGDALGGEEGAMTVLSFQVEMHLCLYVIYVYIYVCIHTYVIYIYCVCM